MPIGDVLSADLARLFDFVCLQVTTRRFIGHSKDVLSVAFSADNRQVRDPLDIVRLLAASFRTPICEYLPWKNRRDSELQFSHLTLLRVLVCVSVDRLWFPRSFHQLVEHSRSAQVLHH